ncbi:GtrA family protein [Bacillus sp. DJP31]|uniref:GtrA family protein n=1 Tax=Bacillus sp. DJP31 TaxID=3409789 RepID=UPI003BB56185
MIIIHVKKTVFQFFTYGIIGSMNALIDIGSLNLLLFLLPTTSSTLLLLFNTIAFTIAAVNSYFLNSRLTFRHQQGNGDSVQLLLFTIQAISCLLISNIVFIESIRILQLFIHPSFLVHNISKMLSMILSSSASFIFLKYFVFNNQKRSLLPLRSSDRHSQ